MSFATAQPETSTVAAGEIPAVLAGEFAAQAQLYQVVRAQAAVIHQMFIATLAAGAAASAAGAAAGAITTS